MSPTDAFASQAAGRSAPADLFAITGKVALVTGGGRGIGRMIATGLLCAGARVYVASRRIDGSDPELAELHQIGDLRVVRADIASPTACRDLIDRIGKDEPELHLLINNAGVTWGASLDDFDERGWERVIAVNLAAPFHLARHARHLLKAASRPGDPARIINIGSIDGLLVSTFDNFSYGASKAGLHHLTRHLAKVLAPDILVNAIALGPFQTKMMAAALAERGDEIASFSPLNRIGTPEDIAGAIQFLSSRASSFITGAVIPLDGGITTTVSARAGDHH